jgi:hypothetical protein
MKTMIWKELRENFKWALLGFLGLLFAEICVLFADRRSGDGGVPLCGSAFLIMSSFGCSAIGAALGAIQILPELRRDQWAALLHRPVPRGVIFFGKALAGLALYFAATIIPLLASACFVAIPRNFAAPFIPASILPALSDVLLGVAFYFTALLACLHQGKWFGAKGAIMLSVLPVFLLHTLAANSFLLLPIAASLLLMLAARGALLGNGPAAGMPPLGRAAYFLVVLAGIQTALCLLDICAQSLPGHPTLPVRYSNRGFQVTKEGQVLELTPRPDGSGEQVTDVDGKPVTDERYLGSDSSDYLCSFTSISRDLKAEALVTYYRGLHRSPYHYLSEITQFDESGLWYLLVKGNYFVGYDRLSRRFVGFLDQDGFKSPGATLNPFPEPLRFSRSGDNPFLVTSGSRVYSIDFFERTITIYFDTGNSPIYAATTFTPASNAPRTPPDWLAVAAADGIHICNSGKQLITLPYQYDPARWSWINVAASQSLNRIYLQSQKLGADSGPGALPHFLDEFDLQGHLLRTYTLPVPTVSPAPLGWAARFVEYTAPLAPVLIARIHSRLVAPLPAAYGLSSPLPRSFASGSLRILCAIAIALAAATFLWARGIGLSAASALRWAAFAFLFGPAGLLTFRLATDWPIRLPCPSCGKKRPIEAAQCLHCHQPWTISKPTGTEILDLSVG